MGSSAITSRAPRAISGSTVLCRPRLRELMKVISFSIDQMRIEGWLRSSLTQAFSCSIQLSNSSRPLANWCR